MIYKNILSVVLAFLLITQLSACSGVQPQLVVNEAPEGESEDVELVEEVSTQIGDTIFVHISGAVEHPGMYEMDNGSRLYDAVMEAGGFSTDASRDYANLAEVLVDGQKYDIYTEDEVLELATSEHNDVVTSYTSDGLLDINMATKDELMNLSGIGESKADAIVSYRQQQGLFQSIEDIMNVSGVGEGVFGQIRDYITVR